LLQASVSGASGKRGATIDPPVRPRHLRPIPPNRCSAATGSRATGS